MDILLELARVRDETIGDVAAFFGLEREQVYDQAATWSQRQRAMLAEGIPGDHYAHWLGDDGRANVCLNTIDQFYRTDVFAVICQLHTAGLVRDVVDFGCGTGVVSYPHLSRCRSAVMVDVPNVAQDFLRWRLERDRLHHVILLHHEAVGPLPAESFDLVCCIDVLEHLPEPTQVFEQFDRWLRPGGFYLHRAPWAESEEDEREVGHLLAAPVDWNRPGGAAEQLARRYERLAPVSFGGLYRKL
ncbi:MAG: class I SAM-dependent methyltransferase [Armatimonadetes bacterium]|nr:class I SAM-dependent methyltransferase [Armatimonadota bacterium]